MKQVVLIALMAITSLSLSAQSKIESSFGIKGGANFSRFEIKDADSDFNTLWHVGLLAHLHMSDKIAIQPELVYSRTGGERNPSGIEYDDVNDYLTVPVLFQYMISNGFRIQAGPQVGFLLKARQTSEGTETDTKEYYKKTDFGLAGGFSYLTKSGLGFDARYVYGLTDISNKETVTPGSNDHVKNRVIQVGLFYQFSK
jgi:hypothetical protein